MVVHICCLQLMKHVRLPLLSREFLMTHVDSESLVRENAECKELLLEAMRYHLLPEQRSSLATQRTTSRKPDGMKPFVFAVGKHKTRLDFFSFPRPLLLSFLNLFKEAIFHQNSVGREAPCLYVYWNIA